MLVLESVEVFVDVDEAVCVFDIAEEADEAGLEEDDLEPVPERVDVIVEVIVFVEVGEGVNSRVGSEDRVEVVVFVDVLDVVAVLVGTT